MRSADFKSVGVSLSLLFSSLIIIIIIIVANQQKNIAQSTSSSSSSATTVPQLWWLTPRPHSYFLDFAIQKVSDKKKSFSTGDSRVVPHLSTRRAQWCLTSEFGWDLVVPPWSDRTTGERAIVVVSIIVSHHHRHHRERPPASSAQPLMMVAGNFVYFKNIFQIHKVCAHLRWWWPNDDDDGARSCTMMTMVVADDDEDDDDVDHEHG